MRERDRAFLGIVGAISMVAAYGKQKLIGKPEHELKPGDILTLKVTKNAVEVQRIQLAEVEIVKVEHS